MSVTNTKPGLVMSSGYKSRPVCQRFLDPVKYQHHALTTHHGDRLCLVGKLSELEEYMATFHHDLPVKAGPTGFGSEADRTHCRKIYVYCSEYTKPQGGGPVPNFFKGALTGLGTNTTAPQQLAGMINNLCTVVTSPVPERVENLLGVDDVDRNKEYRIEICHESKTSGRPHLALESMNNGELQVTLGQIWRGLIADHSGPATLYLTGAKTVIAERKTA